MTTIPLNTESKTSYHNDGRARSQSRGGDAQRQSRPTTPLRTSSRENSRSRRNDDETPIDALLPSFQEFDDAITQLTDNLYALQEMHESIAKFNENFASLLYGLNMNAFCVDFPETPTIESFRRTAREAEEMNRAAIAAAAIAATQNHQAAEMTFMTNDTFVDQPNAGQNHDRTKKTSTRGGTGNRGNRGTSHIGRGRGTGIARGRATNNGRLTTR